MQLISLFHNLTVGNPTKLHIYIIQEMERGWVEPVRIDGISQPTLCYELKSGT